MQTQFSRRGGSFTIEEMDADVAGQHAARDGVKRGSNPHSPGTAKHKAWDVGHCAALGVDPAAPVPAAPKALDATPAESAPAHTSKSNR